MLPSARLFLCARCRSQVVLCRACDRGQLYCSPDCSAASRTDRQRESRRRHASSAYLFTAWLLALRHSAALNPSGEPHSNVGRLQSVAPRAAKDAVNRYRCCRTGSSCDLLKSIVFFRFYVGHFRQHFAKMLTAAFLRFFL